MSAGELLTRWTIRVALLLYVLALATQLANGSRPKQSAALAPWQAARWLWTLACAAFILHVAAAFHYYHQWSHALATASTLQQTRERTGIAFGGGIYFNYALLAVWFADCVWWWASPVTYRERNRVITWLVQGYILFMAIQGAIVFEAGPTRWVGLVALTVLMAMALGNWWKANDAKELA